MSWVVAAALGVVSVPVAGLAQGGPGAGPCTADVARFCKDVERGEGRIRQCLQGHLPDLSPECRTHVASNEGGQGRARFRTACRKELDSFCKDVTPGGGGLKRCLRSHEGELSADCKQAVAGRGGPGPAGK
jgi:hypothetical protein